MRTYGERKTTRIMMPPVPHVIVWAGHTKYQADGFLFDWVYHECVHHAVDAKFSCCAEFVAISCMKVGKGNKNKSKSLMCMLSDNKIVIWWSGYFLYRALCGNCSVGNGDCVRNQVQYHVCRCFLSFPFWCLKQTAQNMITVQEWITVQNCNP